MKKTRWIKTGAIFIFALLAFVVETDLVFAKTITGRISAKTVKVGGRIQITTSVEGAAFSSSNSVIASLDSSGTVTGKKAGKVKIYAHPIFSINGNCVGVVTSSNKATSSTSNNHNGIRTISVSA